jgi:hypothetical protein
MNQVNEFEHKTNLRKSALKASALFTFLIAAAILLSIYISVVPLILFALVFCLGVFSSIIAVRKFLRPLQASLDKASQAKLNEKLKESERIVKESILIIALIQSFLITVPVFLLFSRGNLSLSALILLPTSNAYLWASFAMFKRLELAKKLWKSEFPKNNRKDS